jgi:hypothetical protein
LTVDPEVVDTLARLVNQSRVGQHGVVIRLAGQRVRLRCDLPDGVRVAQTILGPYCDIGPDDAPSDTGEAGWTVLSSVVADFADVSDHLCKRLASAGVPATPVRRWFGDDDADRFDYGPGRSVVVHRRPFAGLTVFSRDEREICYLRPAAAFDVPHTEHVIKYPFRVTLRQAGQGQVHAAGCGYRGRGLLLMGEKGSGKSTLLARFMSRGAKQVSNDVLFLRLAPGAVSEMIAFPHMTRLASGTIEDNPVLRDALAREARTGDYLRSPVFSGGKEEFYYPVLERIWGSDPVQRRINVDLLVFPALDLGCREASVRMLTGVERSDRIRRALINDPPYPDWLPFLTAAEFAALAAAAANALVSREPAACELRFGTSETDPVGVVEDVLDRLYATDNR